MMSATPRRDFLKLAVAAALAATSTPLESVSASAETLGPPTPFAPENVANMARELAKAPFKAPQANLPDPFGKLNFEQYASIRRNLGVAIWQDANSPFALEPLHRGFIFAAPVELNLVEGGQSQRVIYDRSLYDFGKLQVPGELGDLGFSGVRILSNAGAEGWKDEAIFQGATFFRSHASGQTYGVNARALSLRTGDPQGEEFPVFRSLWIEKPSPAADALVIHALLDSASLTGAFRFTLRAGDATIIDTELTLFARVAVDHLGLGSMSATYLFGPLDHFHSDDVRANVYDVSGLQILTGAGEWIWRPIANRENLQISAFGDKNPRGFGLLQRNRNFDSFGDDDAHWELRPSLWIEPIGDWGEGEVMLLEIPAESENNDNILAQWRPKAALAEGGSVSYAYRQFWSWTPPAHPDLATAVSSRIGKIGKRRRFIVEFVSDLFADPQKAAETTAALEASPGQIVSVRLFPNKDRRSVRVAFDLDPGSDSYTELRLALKLANQLVSETWLYRWTA
jgi:periplasmic glucans biosynthesis protein